MTFWDSNLWSLLACISFLNFVLFPTKAVGFEQEMILIDHQAIGIASPLRLLYFATQDVKNFTPIRVMAWRPFPRTGT